MQLTFKEVYLRSGSNNQSTSAWQRDKFIKFFKCTGSGRARKYSPECIDVLKIISSMYSDGKVYEEILEVLENNYGVQITDVVTQPNTVATQQDIVETIRLMFVDELSKRDRDIERLEQKIDCLTSVSDERDKLLMENIKLIREQQEQQQPNKWWHKLFNK